MARIVLGITGGIAAYKACEVIRLLVGAGHEVIPVPTRGAERFVAAETFAALARSPVAHAGTAGLYPHLQRADLLVIAPLTAHTMARLAHGLADDILTETALAHDGPILAAPAMNTRMWNHPATQANVALLRERGVEIVGPASGELAEGEVGMGRMAEPAEIASRIEYLLRAAGSLDGLDVVVTAGGTREPIDSIRFVGNRSSGRMGLALAAEARRRGARVTLLAANVTAAVPPGVTVIETPTAADLEREALQRSGADVILMAAAVGDYRAAAPVDGKRAKDDDVWQIALTPTPDIARQLGMRRTAAQVLVAFGAEHGAAGLERKRGMLVGKNVDLVVYNDVGRDDIGFDVPDNEVTLVTADGDTLVPRAPKAAIAVAVLDEVERLLEGRR
ncbi:bifunctional phosphopantothenoylcysteine decarboxylase/phosphopantothenate--cysteine ligase CoaBC [Gaiella sp.]|uniref:bifunctional phosphopantothenoylcysteine decarboxylase/phosphopantothenate--cysteine ligase CoaBC n=1 Tax=Gaiella sp. TaxID=2663207 RepID=UPI0039837F38